MDIKRSSDTLKWWTSPIKGFLLRYQTIHPDSALLILKMDPLYVRFAYLLSKCSPLCCSQDHVLNPSCFLWLHQCNSRYCNMAMKKCWVKVLSISIMGYWDLSQGSIIVSDANDSHLSRASGVKKADNIVLLFSSACCCCASCSSWLGSPPCIRNCSMKIVHAWRVLSDCVQDKDLTLPAPWAPMRRIASISSSLSRGKGKVRYSHGTR